MRIKKKCYSTNLKNISKNYSLDFGLYGIYDKDDIYTAYGGNFSAIIILQKMIIKKLTIIWC